MTVNFVTTEGVSVMGLETDYIFPAKGDVVVAPDGQAFVIVQRTFIARELPAAGKVVDLAAPRAVDIHMQVVLQAVSVEGKDSAIKS